MNAPTTVVRDGHVTGSWHRARRRAADLVFTATRIREGMTVGASVEIDPGCTPTAVSRSCTISMWPMRPPGAATSALGANQLRAMSLVDNRRRRIDEPVLLLRGTSPTPLRTTTIHPTPCSSSISRTASALDDRALQTFADAVAPHRPAHDPRAATL